MSQPRPEHDGPEPEEASPYSRHGAPPPLVAAAGLTLVEGLLTFGFGVTEVMALDRDRLTLGATTAVFFLVYGATLIACAWGMNSVRSWARGPVLLAQLIWFGIAWNLRGGDTRPVAIVLAVLSVLVLAGLLHPRSVDAIERAAGRA